MIESQNKTVNLIMFLMKFFDGKHFIFCVVIPYLNRCDVFEFESIELSVYSIFGCNIL